MTTVYLEDWFLNDELRAIIEGDGHDEDDECYGFSGPLPAVPAPDWGDTERMDLVHRFIFIPITGLVVQQWTSHEGTVPSY